MIEILAGEVGPEVGFIVVEGESGEEMGIVGCEGIGSNDVFLEHP